MTDTRSPHALRRPLVITGLGLVALLVLTAIGFLTLRGQIRDFDYTTTVSAGSDVRITGDNANVNLRPSADGRVHVHAHAHGQYRRSQPQVSGRQVPNGAVIDESCDGSGPFELCDISVDVDLPPDNTVSVTGTNGSLTAQSLTGNLSLTTTNGDIRASGIRSATLSATSDNGAESLSFATSPIKVNARTTNGGITVTVPNGTSYDVHPTTTNGRITLSVPNGDSPDHVITAITENGSITVRGT